MSKETNTQLSRREREIMDVIYRMGRATAAEVLDQLADPPSYSAVRALLRVLEDKGHLRHEEDGQRYVFLHLLRWFHGAGRSGAARSLFDTPVRCRARTLEPAHCRRAEGGPLT